MRRVCRWAIPIVALLALMPAAAQSRSSSGRPVKGAATCLGKPATFEASSGNHLVVGTPRADVIVGTRGADQIRGRGGNDLICGGGSSDLLDGGPGRDRLSGGSGDDLVLGGAGRDRLSGGSGTDHLVGDASRDWCSGDDGTNTYVSCEVIPSERPPADHPPAPSNPGTIDHPPSAVNDTFVVDENAAAASIDVLANDTDVDGGPSTVESATEPHHGKVAIAVDGAGLTYEPAGGYCNDGEPDDTFTYSLNGGSIGTVTVRVRCVTTVATDPTLTPPFDPAVSDYATRCTGQPLEVSGRTAAGTTVAVDGDESASGKFESTVPLEENQAFRFTTTAEGESKTYTVRCLPSGFPEWDFEEFRQPSHELYVVAPNLISPLAQYVVIFDRDGVPVWWDTEPGGTLQDAKVLSNGSLAWWNASDGYVIRKPDGALIQHVTAVGGDTDGHELQQLLPSGNSLLISSETREDVDLTEFGGAPHENVLEGVVEEVSPSGELLWKWSTKDHIGLAETGRWWPTALAMPEPRDIIHMNAVEPAGKGAVLISVRHTDAVYKIDKATGEIVWKLGGTWTPKSLQVLNDPEGAYPLGGQHDVRLLPDGTITIHDNNTGLSSPPRAVRYAIDEASRTATLVEQVTDPLVSSSFCCGSARRSADGSWLISWGGNSAVTEYDAAKQPNFRLSFGGTLFSYRAVPVADGVLSVSSLRAGMDAMHPR
jgi:hypothetical protein